MSLKSPARSTPVSPVEPHMRSKDQLICETGNTLHRSKAKTRTEKHERIVAATPSISTKLPISSLKCFERLPWQLWRSRNTHRHSTPLSASVTRKTVNPHYSWRFVAKSLSRVARPARGAVRTRCVLVQYDEGPRGEPAGRRLVVATDRRLQQKCS